MEVVKQGRVNLTPMLTDHFDLDEVVTAYELFGERRDGVMKVPVKP